MASPVLAFVDIFVDSTTSPEDVAGALSHLPNVVKLYEVRGQFYRSQHLMGA